MKPHRIAYVLAAMLCAQGCGAPPERRALRQEEEQYLECAILYHRAQTMKRRAAWLAKSGMSRQALSEYEGALDCIRQIRERDNRWNEDSVSALEQACAAGEESLRETRALRDLRVADALARFAMQQAADGASAKPHLELGDFYFGEREYADAMRQYEEVLRKEPGNISAQMNIARIHSRMGDYEAAEQLYCRIIAANPENPAAHYNLGSVYFRTKKPTYAMREYERALELRPDYPEAHNAIGILCKQLRRYDEAIAHFRTAIDLRPDYAAAYQNLGLAMMGKNNYPSAVSYLRRAIELFGPESPEGQAIAEGLKRMRRYR